ncbi:hypothetical protein GQ42DRAFT_162021 [Ramicandelaber brevisporus]|nr:hypothetical protein GQ42DRAFT_162021 [Ramicandelaber brevisporus]
MFHLFPSLLVRPLFRWLSPPPLASHWVVAMTSTPVPPVGAVAMAILFSFGLVRFDCSLVRFGSFVFGSDHLHGYRLAALHGINETLDTL